MNKLYQAYCMEVSGTIDKGRAYAKPVGQAFYAASGNDAFARARKQWPAIGRALAVGLIFTPVENGNARVK